MVAVCWDRTVLCEVHQGDDDVSSGGGGGARSTSARVQKVGHRPSLLRIVTDSDRALLNDARHMRAAASAAELVLELQRSQLLVSVRFVQAHEGHLRIARALSASASTAN